MAISLTNEDILEVREIFQKLSPWIGNAFTEEEIWVATVIEFIKTSEKARLLLQHLKSLDQLEQSKHPLAAADPSLNPPHQP